MNEVQQAIRSWLKDLIKEVIQEIMTENTQLTESQFNPLERFYTREEVCEKLNICHATYHNWVNGGKLKKVKIQGRSYIDAACLDKALEEGTIKTKFNIKPRKK